MPNAEKRLRRIKTAKTKNNLIGLREGVLGLLRPLMILERTVLVDWEHRFTKYTTGHVSYTRHNETPVLLKISILDK